MSGSAPNSPGVALADALDGPTRVFRLLKEKAVGACNMLTSPTNGGTASRIAGAFGKAILDALKRMDSPSPRRRSHK